MPEAWRNSQMKRALDIARRSEQKRQTTLSVTYSNFPMWYRRFQDMRQCTTLDALVALHGPPSSKVSQDGFEMCSWQPGLPCGPCGQPGAGVAVSLEVFLCISCISWFRGFVVPAL